MMPALIDYLVALDLHLGNLRVYQRGEGCHRSGVNEVAIMVENVNVDIDNLDCLPLLKYQRFHVDSLGFSDPSVYHSRVFYSCFAPPSAASLSSAACFMVAYFFLSSSRCMAWRVLHASRAIVKPSSNSDSVRCPSIWRTVTRPALGTRASGISASPSFSSASAR